MKQTIQKLKTQIDHPSIVLVPLFSFLLLTSFFNYLYVACGCLLLTGILFLQVHWSSQRLLNTALLLFAALPLLGVLLVYSLPSLTYFQHKVNLFVELVIFVETSLYILFRMPILRFIERHYAGVSNMKKKNHCSEFLYIIRIMHAAFSIHIIVLTFYYLLEGWGRTDKQDSLFFNLTPLFLLAAISLYEVWRTRFFRSQLSKEIWLPVVDERGVVKGVVARSVTFASGNRHCNPVVRMVFEQGGMLYVKPREEEAHIQVGKLDYPIGGYLPFRISAEDYMRQLLASYPALAQLPSGLLLKYLHRDEQTHRLVFLFLVQIPVSENLSQVVPGGKLWTKQMIDANIGKGVFSTFFEEEYAFLRDTILLE